MFIVQRNISWILPSIIMIKAQKNPKCFTTTFRPGSRVIWPSFQNNTRFEPILINFTKTVDHWTIILPQIL